MGVHQRKTHRYIVGFDLYHRCNPLGFCLGLGRDRKESRILTMVDEYVRECQMIRTERFFGANEVIESLQLLFAIKGLPRYIHLGNGFEFIANALKEWLNKMGCRTI